MPAHTIINPDGLHDSVPFGYSHTAALPAGAELVLVSGQYASDAHGAVVSPEFGAQVTQVFDNLATALAAHGLELADVVQLRSYVVGIDFDRLGAIGREVAGRCGPLPPTQTVLGVAGLATPDIQVEIEAVAVRSRAE